MGDARKMIFVLSSMAALAALTSTSKSSSRGTRSTLPFDMRVKKLYIPKVGSKSITLSPGFTNSLNSRSISSSLPAPAMTLSAGAPV